jgi:AcrR family transcriptional regulator
MPATSSHRPRRTQAERTAAMRARLLDATVDCLVERGYAGTTTTEVARRAGVSGGALTHHFPAKADLVVAAVEHVFDRRQHEFREAFEDLPPERRQIPAALDLLWEIFQGPTFAAWLELIVAARTDPALRPPVHEVTARLDAGVREIFTDLFPQAPPAETADLVVAFAFALLEGLGLQHTVGMGPRAGDVLGMVKSLSHLLSPTSEVRP